jgi:DNA mismatch endonuclease, patch repair protein
VVDTLSRKKRSDRMSRIRSKNTVPELKLRKLLHAHGLRFRIHDAKLPGRPDIVLRKYRTVIDVRGCFFHRHQGCRVASTPKTNTRFWLEKFSVNVRRDARNERALRRSGWTVLVVWECKLGSRARTEATLRRVLRRLKAAQ